MGFAGCSWEHCGQGEWRGLKKRRWQKLEEGKKENLGGYRRERLQRGLHDQLLCRAFRWPLHWTPDLFSFAFLPVPVKYLILSWSSWPINVPGSHSVLVTRCFPVLFHLHLLPFPLLWYYGPPQMFYMSQRHCNSHNIFSSIHESQGFLWSWYL